MFISFSSVFHSCFIREHSVVWVNRAEAETKSCDEIGRALIDLGAVCHTQALASIGANAIVYVEGQPDKQALRVVLDMCGKNHILDHVRVSCGLD